MYHTEIRSKSKVVAIGRDLPAVIIGERINPTGKKKFGQALLARDFEAVRREAITQVEQGADVLDVNVGVALVLGSVPAAQLGSRLSHRAPLRVLHWIMTGIIAFSSLKIWLNVIY